MRLRVYSQDRELFWLGCTTQSTNLVRDFHSVRYPVRRTTENRSWYVFSQWYSCLTLNSEHLVGFRRNYYCAYSDTEVRVNYFELHIDSKFTKRGVIYLFLSILIQLFICWLFSIGKCTYNRVYAFTVCFFHIKLRLQLI